ncbi:MAG: TIGR02996 domain-containing protein [Isosphaeraceae bacterium]
MTTAEEIALVEAIHADPRADGPRLTYAAWLFDHGAADYAEFIRIQCERPYVTISTRDGPHVSSTYRFPWGDVTAEARLKRVLALYPTLLASERFAPFRQDYYYQEFRRGLATWEVDSDLDLCPTGQVREPSAESGVLIAAPPLLRFRLCLQTTAEALVSWLTSPGMRRVDWLRLSLERDYDSPEVEPFIDLQSVGFSFLRGLEEIAFGDMFPVGLRGTIAGQARAAGVIESDEY